MKFRRVSQDTTPMCVTSAYARNIQARTHRLSPKDGDEPSVIFLVAAGFFVVVVFVVVGAVVAHVSSSSKEWGRIQAKRTQ